MGYSPAEDLGLREETQLIMSCNGILTSNDFLRSLCSYAIRNGGRFYDVVTRYSNIYTNALGRVDNKYGSVAKMIIPFLKAFGVTDYSAYQEAKKDLILMPGADHFIKYVSELMPTFINTSAFEHHVMALCDAVDIPNRNIGCTRVDFDTEEADKQECRTLREYANRISSLRVPDTVYTFEKDEMLSDGDADIITLLDEFFREKIPEMEIYKTYKDIATMGAEDKSCAALEIRRHTSIEFDSTVCIGSSATDSMVLELTRDCSGLSISFNGCEYAVRNCNVAVMCNDCIVNSVLAAEFYDKGIESVFEMVDNWNRKYLKSCNCADRNLMDEMLRRFPRKLPIVKRVDRRNADEIVAESNEYRMKVAECNRRH